MAPQEQALAAIKDVQDFTLKVVDAGYAAAAQAIELQRELVAKLAKTFSD